MAKRHRKMPPLTPRGRQLLSYVMNSVAFDRHSEDAELETMAEKLGTTAPRLLRMLDKLQQQGWLTIEGRVAKYVYPTVAAIRWTNPNVSVAEAEAIIRRVHRR